MSRVGKKIITLPAKVDFKIDGREVFVKGPKGELKHTLPETMSVSQENGSVQVERASDSRTDRALHGLTRALVSNMVTGVSTGFRRTLIIEGTGYSAEMRGKQLVMKLGYSHEIPVPAPEGISFEVPTDRKGTVLHIDGIDKQVVGQVAADIRKLRPPEPYKGKGVRYSDEIVRRKAGKSGAAKKK
ncbi:MAG: 50S ribosomal protein L6 [Anaerolineae bacterium]|jgi:large subunit ribosomal protein L6|nr:50S ribosomal protein L6 [Anaerolineae bacterium]